MNNRVRPGCLAHRTTAGATNNSLPEQKSATKPEYDNIRDFVQGAWGAPRTANTQISPYPRVRSGWLAVLGPSFAELSRVRSGCLAEERGELSKQPDCMYIYIYIYIYGNSWELKLLRIYVNLRKFTSMYFNLRQFTSIMTLLHVQNSRDVFFPGENKRLRHAA